MANSNDAFSDNAGANDKSIAEQELRVREIQIREREVKNNYRLSIFKVIITGTVATLIPAIINWQIQSQNIEIERLKSEQSYLKDFVKDALQEDLNKRYNFADYLATVAHSGESRKRWDAYRKKIEQIFDNEAENKRQIKEIRANIEDIARNKDQEASAKISKLQDELYQRAHDIRSLRKRYQTQGAPLTSGIVFTERYGKSSIRFKVRNLNLDNQGNAKFVRKGGRIEATMEIMHDCQECGTA